MRIRYLATAVPLLLAGALAATAPGTSQAADPSDKGAAAPTTQSAKLAAITPCRGGKQKRALMGGSSDWISTSSTSPVPGTELLFRGPRKRRDTVFVTFTAPDTWASASDYGRVRVQLDGVDMKPASGAAEYFYEHANNSSFAGQYCARVGKGLHQVEVILEANGASPTVYLRNPMLYAEVAE